MTGMSSLHICDNTGCRVEWAGKSLQRTLRFLFKWGGDDPKSDAFPFIIEGVADMVLEYTVKEEAETAMVMGHLDHFKATAMSLPEQRDITTITFTYQGKIEPTA